MNVTSDEFLQKNFFCFVSNVLCYGQQYAFMHFLRCYIKRKTPLFSDNGVHLYVVFLMRNFFLFLKVEAYAYFVGLWNILQEPVVIPLSASQPVVV